MGDINDYYRHQVQSIIKRLTKIECEYGEIFVENEDCLTTDLMDAVEGTLINCINVRQKFEAYLKALEENK